MPKSQVPCSFYLTNSCTKGNNCPFSHGQHTSSRVVCRHYTLGTCMYGDRCRNSHNILEVKADSGDQHCKYWKRGSCAKGNECRFIHEPVTRPSASTTWRPQTTSMASIDTKPTHEKILCIFWKSGRCSRGARCEYLHNPVESADVSPEKQQGQSLPAFGRRLGSRPGDRAEHEGQSTIVSGRAINQSDWPQISDATNVRETLPKSSEIIPGEQKSHEGSHPESSVERSFLDGVRAMIGPGGAVQTVVTAFESSRVTLANIPDQASQQDLITIAETFGPLKSVVLAPVVLGTKRTAKLEYLGPDAAKAAAEALDGMELHTKPLAAQLDLRSNGTDTADLRSSTLKMSWFTPARMAYAHYSSIYQASSKAKKLDGENFCGRTVAAVFQPPSPLQTINFTVIIKNLPLHIQVEDLRKFCGSNSVRVSEASYHGKEGIAKIQKLLETFGPLESFDRSSSAINDVKVKALARFAKPEHAATAAKELQGKSHSSLGGAKTWITLLHSMKYNISKAQYRILKDDLRRLQTGDAQNAKVRVYDKDEQGRPVDPVCIRIYGDDPKILGRLKTQVEAAVLGEEVTHEGMALWDRFFVSAGSKGFVDEVQTLSGAFIRVDSRRRKLRVSGSSYQKDRARGLLVQKFKELAAQRHQISLTNVELGRLLQGEFARLQGVLGQEKLSLDVRKRVLIVRGDEEDIEAARLSSKIVQTTPALPANQDTQSADCPVCFCEVTTPVALVCGHSYCFACLRHYLASAETFPVKCLGEDGRCDLPIPLSTISHLLPVGDETKFFEDAFLAYIHQHPQEYHYCPTADCQQIYRPAASGNVLRCPSCLSRICPSCHVEFHEGQTCAEHRYSQSDEELAYQKWKESNDVKACPNCKADIEKSAGCNHMTCTVCRTHMCWVCRATFPDGKNIYEHMRIQHGGIGI